LVLNEEFLVNVSHNLTLIKSLPFVHTARRSYRLNVKGQNNLVTSGKEIHSVKQRGGSDCLSKTQDFAK